MSVCVWVSKLCVLIMLVVMQQRFEATTVHTGSEQYSPDTSYKGNFMKS